MSCGYRPLLPPATAMSSHGWFKVAIAESCQTSFLEPRKRISTSLEMVKLEFVSSHVPLCWGSWSADKHDEIYEIIKQRQLVESLIPVFPEAQLHLSLPKTQIVNMLIDYVQNSQKSKIPFIFWQSHSTLYKSSLKSRVLKWFLAYKI